MARAPSMKGRKEQILGDPPAADPDDVPPWESADTPTGEPEGDGGGAETGATEGAGEPTSGDVSEPFQSFIGWLAAKAVETDADTYAAMADLVEEMAQANSPAEVLAGGFPMHAAEVLGRPFIIERMRIREGNYEESENMGYYAALFGRFADTGQERVVTCGGKRVMGKLWGLDVRDALPITVKIVERPRKGKPPVQDLLPGD